MHVGTEGKESQNIKDASEEESGRGNESLILQGGRRFVMNENQEEISGGWMEK